MIILTSLTIISIGAAIYFVVQNGKLSGQIDDKEMVISALQRQAETDKRRIAELKMELEMTHNKPVSATAEQKSAPRKPRRPKQN
jgi:peptidoglycan hydrolase CwlO-like protein